MRKLAGGASARGVCGVLAMGLAVLADVEATEVAFDWLAASGVVTVPAGVTYVATESDMAAVNALSSITIEGAPVSEASAEGTAEDETTTDPAAGVLEFRSCATFPKSGLLHGAGVVKKTGDDNWDFAVTNPDFDGDFRICGGRVVTTTAGAFGKTTKGTAGAVYVESGASLKIASTAVKFAYRPLHIAGSGFGSDPADRALNIDTTASGAVGLLYLDADATVFVRNNSNHYWMGDQGNPFGDNSGGSRLYTEGHALTKTGAMDWYIKGLTVEGTGRLICAEGKIVLRENTNLGPADADPFEIRTATSLTFYNNPKPVLRPLRVENPLNVIYAANDSHSSVWPLLTTNSCNWAGPITLDGANARLTIALGGDHTTKDRGHDRQFSFMGNISGAGALVVGSADRAGCGRVVLGGRNTCTGTTTVYGGDSSRLLAYWHDSIPDYAKTTVDRGYVAARLGMGADGATERWPKEKLFAFRNTATFSSGGAFAIDATECPDGLFELTAKELLANDARHDIGWGAAGGTVRITSEDGDVLPICPNAYSGTLELTGPGAFEMVGTNEIASVAGVATNDETRVVVTGGATVRQGKLPVFLGRANDYKGAYYPKAAGRLVVANAAWLSTVTGYPTSASQEAMREGALFVGSYGAGILDIQDGGLVSNKIVVGGGDFQSGGSRGNGAVYVGAGGRLHVLKGGSAAHFASMLGMGGFGYLQVEAGAELAAESPFAVGGYGTGVLHQYGGAFAHTDDLYVQKLNGGDGVLYVAGGTCTIGKNLFVACGNAASEESRGVVTVDGADAVLKVGDRCIYFGSQSPSCLNNRAWLNLNNGGRVHVDRLVPYANALDGSAYVGFDGGTVRRTSWSNFIHQFPSRVRLTVYEKGAAFDCEADTAISPEVPLAGRVAGGIQSVDASAVTNGFWIGAPYVNITGDGEGASAVADWDPVARRLKGVKLTSHGWGYSADKVKVTLFTSHRSETLSNATDAVRVTVGDNVIGGLTKLGSKTLTLTATNSWQKWTQVDAGTLVAGSNGAIPSGTELRLNGGTIDLGGFDADSERPLTFAGLAGTGGKAVNGVVRLTGVWEISAKRFLVRETAKLDGTLDLSGVTEIRLVDADELDGVDAATARALSLVTATTVVWPETLTLTGAPKGWRFVRSGDRAIRLGLARGAMVIVR